MDESKYHTIIEGIAGSPPLSSCSVRRIYEQVFRTGFGRPGVALLSFREHILSPDLRLFMWSLKQALSTLHYEATGKHLVYLSMGRFDSQVTTKFHLDGAPDEAFLMLGYESSPVHSELAIADYSQAAHDWGIAPRKLLADFNPMFADNEQLLRPYISALTAFDAAQSHILLLNNSSQPYEANSGNFLGVMHQATIDPNPLERRIINSTMISTAPRPQDEPISADTQKQFLETNEITGTL